ncbi:hypothetical protein L9F63_014987, partial [Diploptera punctata]
MEFWIMVMMTVILARDGFAATAEVIVEIEQGRISGATLTTSRSNKTYFSFVGIPYAKPPVGNLRFMRAQPAEHWDGIRDCTKDGNMCPQFVSDTSEFKYVGNEDCLVLNVYTPTLPTTIDFKLPVMVWIHGGEFLYGTGNRIAFEPDYLIEEDVIIVTLNYRLGILGFLSLQDDVVPGNNGLKDQLLALQWVKKNMINFGGDPNQVTIFGESAGAASVHYHLLSPLSKGLFRFAISESGSALSPWALQSPESCVARAGRLATSFGSVTTDPAEILKTLMTVDPEDLVMQTYYQLPKLQRVNLNVFTRNSHYETKNISEAFLPDTPINIIDSGNYFKGPYITGMNNEEAIMAINFFKRASLFLHPVATIFRFILPFYIGQRPTFTKGFLMANEVKSKYFSNPDTFILNYIDVATDLLFGNSIYCTAMKQAKESRVYAYEFSFSGTANVLKKRNGAEEYPGAAHADELSYLFPFSFANVTIKNNTPEYDTSRRMVKMWANFAKFGNPTLIADPLLQNVIWPPVNSTFPYLNIDTNLSVKQNLHNGNYLWWEDLYKKYVQVIQQGKEVLPSMVEFMNFEIK